MSLPPHFPDPNADPIALLEAAIAEKDAIIGAQYAEMQAWRTQLEAALAQTEQALTVARNAKERADRLDVEVNAIVARPVEFGGCLETIAILDRKIMDLERENSRLSMIIINLSPRTRKKALRGAWGMSLAELRAANRQSPELVQANRQTEAALARVTELEALMAQRLIDIQHQMAEQL